MKLTIEFTHFWHCGSGRSGGKKVDTLVEKDRYNLPYVPGKTLKGIVREAVRKAEAYGSYDDLGIKTESNELIENILFGSRDEKRENQFSGIISVSDASLSTEESNYLIENKDKIALLYRNINQTKIEQKTGTAADGSLRGQEVTIPMTLSAEIDIFNFPVSHKQVTGDTLSEIRQKISKQSMDIINRSLVYIDGIGSLRQRGLGRCLLKLEA